MMTEQKLEDIDVDLFISLPQVRAGLDPAKVTQMAHSIAAVGQLHPILARRVGDKFTPVDGHYRLAAKIEAGHKTITALIEERNLDAGQVIEQQLISNCLREGLTDLEIARGIREHMQQTGCKASQTASRLAFSNSKVSNLLSMLTLSPPILDEVAKGRISTSAAVELSRVQDLTQQAELARRLLDGQLTRDEVAGQRKKAGKPDSGADRSPSRATAILGQGRSISVTCTGLTLESMISLVEEFLAKARRERTRGTELPTFLSLLRDQAKAKPGTT